MKNNNPIILLYLILGLLTACNPSSTETPLTQIDSPTPFPLLANPYDLDTTSWRLISFVGGKGNLSNLIPETEITIEFDSGEIIGSSGCNTYFASYHTDDRNLFIGHIASTERFCPVPENLMGQETTYIDLLRKSKSHIISNQRLQFLDDRGQTILIFVPSH